MRDPFFRSTTVVDATKKAYLSMLVHARCGTYADKKFAELTTKQNMKCRKTRKNAFEVLQPLLYEFEEERDIILNGGHVVIKYMMTEDKGIFDDDIGRPFHYFVVEINHFRCVLFQEFQEAYLSQDWEGPPSPYANLDQKTRDKYKSTDIRENTMFIPKREMSVAEDFTGVTGLTYDGDSEPKESYHKTFGEGIKLHVLKICHKEWPYDDTTWDRQWDSTEGRYYYWRNGTEPQWERPPVTSPHMNKDGKSTCICM